MDGNPFDIGEIYKAPILKVKILKDGFDYPVYLRDYTWSIAHIEWPWYVCSSILREAYPRKSYSPAKDFERLMLKIFESYPKVRYHK